MILRDAWVVSPGWKWELRYPSLLSNPGGKERLRKIMPGSQDDPWATILVRSFAAVEKVKVLVLMILLPLYVQDEYTKHHG